MSKALQPSEAVTELAGGAYEGSLNLYGTRVNVLVCTVQVDEWVFVVGAEDFTVSRHALDEWIGGADQNPDPPTIEAETAVEALELLQLVRQDALVWQCGACDAWIFTSNRPRIGKLACSTCGDGGVDFRHADRHVSR